MNFIEQAVYGLRSYPAGAPPIPVAPMEVGLIGSIEAGQFRRHAQVPSTHLRALLRDEERAQRREAEIRELLKGTRWEKTGLPRVAGGTITTWDGVLAARTAGNLEDVWGSKNSVNSVSNQFTSLFRCAGFPVAGTFTNNPGAALNASSTGAVPLTAPTGGNTKYLLNFGANMAGLSSGTMYLVDILYAAGNVNANLNTSQTINTTALTRYTGTGAAGNMIILEVTTACGATPANSTVTYTNQAGTASRSTGAVVNIPASVIVQRLVPTPGGMIIPLQAGDTGVRSVETIQLSAAMGSGVLALNIFRPLLAIPALSSTNWAERSTPGMLGGILTLPVGSDSALGCLTIYNLAGSSVTGASFAVQTIQG